VFIEAKDDGGGGDNWTTGAISPAKLQLNHHHQQINIQFKKKLDVGLLVVRMDWFIDYLVKRNRWLTTGVDGVDGILGDGIRCRALRSRYRSSAEVDPL